MSENIYAIEAATGPAITIRCGRWMITNMEVRRPRSRKPRLYRLMPGGPGSAKVTWKCIFPKPQPLPPHTPYVKPAASNLLKL